MANSIGELASGYVCPLTRLQLKAEDGGLRALGFLYPVENGVPQFLRFGPVEDEKDRARLQELNERSRRDGWKAALRHVFADNPGMLDYVLNPERATFLKLVPIASNSDVLEIGPGLGQFTTRMAGTARSVSALEVVPGQAEFVAQRCEQMGLGNVRVAVGGDDCRLPYPDSSFDVVVLNLVFEWCASRCTATVDELQSASPTEDEVDVQLRLLNEMWRVLRPGGTLYMTTKNRFAIKYLIGKPDEHSFGMRFGSALPRAIWRAALRWKGHDRPGGMLHSYNALAKLLRRANFENLESFWAAPEMRFPQHYVPTDAASVSKARRKAGFRQGDSRSTNLLMRLIPAPLVKHFTPGLTFLARK